jgi:hypothetical protein
LERKKKKKESGEKKEKGIENQKKSKRKIFGRGNIVKKREGGKGNAVERSGL